MKDKKSEIPERPRAGRRRKPSGEPAKRDAAKQPKKPERKRYFRSKREANDWMSREAVVTLSVFVLFFLWQVLALYRETDPARYVLGMPGWFFDGALLGTAVFVVAVSLIVRFFFRELEPDARTSRRKRKQAAVKAKIDAEKTLEGPEGPVDWQTAAAEALAAKNASLALEAARKETEDTP